MDFLRVANFDKVLKVSTFPELSLHLEEKTHARKTYKLNSYKVRFTDLHQSDLYKTLLVVECVTICYRSHNFKTGRRK